MSGGLFTYHDCELKNEIFGCTRDGGKIPNVFEDREISEMVYDVLNLIHHYDWYHSGDTSEYAYLEAKNAFKDKWFGSCDERVKRTIDSAIAQLKQELYKTYNISDEDDTYGN